MICACAAAMCSFKYISTFRQCRANERFFGNVASHRRCRIAFEKIRENPKAVFSLVAA